MGKFLIDEPRVASLETVDSEQDLKPVPGNMNLNPPPQNGRCDCCGRHISELKPFGGAEDPSLGNFTSALLMKKTRPKLVTKRQAAIEIEEILKCRENYDQWAKDHSVKDFLAKIKDGRHWLSEVTFSKVHTTLECRDCAVLNDLEYSDKYNEAVRNGMLDIFRGENRTATDSGKANGLKEDAE